MTLKQLEAFVCVVDMGTFRKAAVVLGTTQPNISARISSLEESIGALLMHRDAGSVRLTEQGVVLLASARNVLWAAEEFLESAKRKDLISERMRLGVSELVACTWLHAFLRRFRAEYPSVVVELQVDMSAEIEKDLAAKQLDLALLTGPFRSEATASIALGKYHYGWVATPEIARTLGPDADLQSLLQASVLTHARHSVASKSLAKHVEATGLASNRIVHSSSLSSCTEMVLDGMGVALLPEILVQGAVDKGRLVRVDIGWLPEPLELFARYDKTRAPLFVRAAANHAVAASIAAPE